MANNNKHTCPNVPALRFPEFSGEWRHYTLGDFCDEFQSGKTIKADSIHSTGQFPVYGGNGLRGYTDSFNHSGEYVLIGRQGALCGNIRFVQGDNYITEHAIAVRASVDNDTRFLRHLFTNLNLGQYSDQSAQPGLAVNKLVRIPAYAPYISEQTKIATFLDLLDLRIATQSKIIEELTTLRSALIEKCSKQSGALFDLSDILQEVDERSTVANQYQVLSSTVKGIFSQKEYFNKDIASEDNKGYKVVRRGHVVLSPQNLWMGNINYNDRFDIGIVSPSYKVYSIRDGFNPIFITSLLRTKKALYEYMLASEQGASIVRRNLNVEAFMAIKFRIPDSRQQDSLSIAINSINAKLNNERTILERLTMQKYSLLENMFI